jgi:hypothetical protein
MVYEPPPNPDDWICDASPPRHTPGTSDTRYTAPSRQGEPMTWEAIRAARPVYDYEPRHAGRTAA